MAEQAKRLVLIDAHAILHRAYHALPEFSNSKGEPTGALYGLAAMLIKIIADLKPDYLAAAYDLPKPTFRHEAYKEYKAGRAKTDDALVAQMKRSRDVFEAFAIPMYDKEGFEADDILGTIVGQVKNEDIVIASGDMDTLQLVDDRRVQVYTLKRGINDTILYDEEKVKERYGFGPELLPDFKGLKGDPSDNIKGIKGIGDKIATELIQKFGSVEEIYKKLKKDNGAFEKEGIKPRIIGLLEAGKEDAEFSKILGTIRRDAPISFSLPETPWRARVDVEKAERLFGELEFRNLGQRLRGAINIPSLPTGDTPFKGGLQKSPLEGSTPTTVGGRDVAELAVALWLINSNLTSPTTDDIFNFAETKDVGLTRAKIFAELKTRQLTRVFEEIEKPLIPIVEKMNEHGVAIDVKYLAALSLEYHKELSALEKAIWKLADGEFNINSPKQLGEIIFNKLQLKPSRQKKTAGGALSTRESELEKMRELHPIIGKILEYREFQKLLSTYIDTIPVLVAADGRLHANFLQAGATTGRMSSQNPNMQNIPVQTKRGQRIRNAFVAEKGFVLLAFDYSQIELRVAAILSGDPKLVEIFKKGTDVHTAVAAEVFGVLSENVTKEMRRQAKVINFGILYGMGVNALRQVLSDGGTMVSRENAQKYLNEYFARFPMLAAYLENTKTAARERGYTETLFGRRRYFEALNSPIPYIRAAAERQVINAPIQGTATADIIKLAMVKVDEFLRMKKLEKDASLILQVHDELVYEVKKESVKNLAAKIKHIMESVLSLEQSRGVPIVVGASVGENWGEMKEI
ncbi:MAG: DNA polymerase I [Parcubacteria group bacterium Gr01-1014_17]|nr:MAG: DNA polymerase I [Parcubacteria group bacterium Gr01-1014_17]